MLFLASRGLRTRTTGIEFLERLGSWLILPYCLSLLELFSDFYGLSREIEGVDGKKGLADLLVGWVCFTSWSQPKLLSKVKSQILSYSRLSFTSNLQKGSREKRQMFGILEMQRYTQNREANRPFWIEMWINIPDPGQTTINKPQKKHKWTLGGEDWTVRFSRNHLHLLIPGNGKNHVRVLRDKTSSSWFKSLNCTSKKDK